jgi:hypothetical protein
MSSKTIWRGWLEIAQLKRLKPIATEQKVSVSWLIRHALDYIYPEAKIKGNRRRTSA